MFPRENTLFVTRTWHLFTPQQKHIIIGIAEINSSFISDDTIVGEWERIITIFLFELSTKCKKTIYQMSPTTRPSQQDAESSDHHTEAARFTLTRTHLEYPAAKHSFVFPFLSNSSTPSLTHLVLNVYLINYHFGPMVMKSEIFLL
jgi:hypothetical protein